jgi:hypothetical protein
VNRERAGAREALDDMIITTPATAGLLARLAAARAVHADLIAAAAGLPTPPEVAATAGLSADSSPRPSADTTPDGSPSPAASASPAESRLDRDSADAISSLLAGEHAAVFAYGLIAARSPSGQKAQALRRWEAHRARRDALERRLVAARRTPVAAEPGYQLGPLPTTPAQVAALATRVEEGLAAVATQAVTASTGAVRLEAATDLVRAARTAAVWRGTAVPLPGQPT